MDHFVKFEDLGLRDYLETWKYQEALFQGLQEKKKRIRSIDQNEKVLNYLLFVEHPHVYTLGKSGSQQNLLLNQVQMQDKNVAFYHTNRGGDITYHGPGQIVCYPILDLESFGLNIREYINFLEESIIITLIYFGIKGERLKSATGVWIDSQVPGNARKICAIGVRASHYVTMHGFAFNVNTDLSYFNYINPCGFTDKSVTSLACELGKNLEMQKVKQILLDSIRKIFQMKWTEG